MLSVERAFLRSNSSSEAKDGQLNPDNERSNLSDARSIVTEVPGEESKIITLEKRINFLRGQHEIMLKSLHEEIENLRRTNKALQFRLVMCSCSASCWMKTDEKDALSTQSHNLENEVKTLTKLLEAERRRNQSLLAQMEAMKMARSVVLELSNESSQIKAARAARGSLGNNSIAVFDPNTEFCSTYPLDVGRSSMRPYTSNLGPFLPALPKTGDAGQVSRQRKARALQRKRLDRTQNLFPP